MRGGAVVAREAHNLEVVGAIPTPATKGKTAPIRGLKYKEYGGVAQLVRAQDS